MASSSAHDAKDILKRLRKRNDNAAYCMPGLTAPKFIICDQYGPALNPAQVPLARALVLFDLGLVRRVHKFHQKRISSTDESRKAESLRWVEDCDDIRQQWRDINSGQRQFSELYMKSNHLVRIWTEGMRIITEVLRNQQVSSNQSKKRDDFARILAEYEDLADNLQIQMVDAAHQDFFDPEFLNPIQERWMRLDETIKLHYDLCNRDVDEDMPPLSRRSLTWPKVRDLVQKNDRGTQAHGKLMPIQLASRSRNAAEPDTIVGSEKVKALVWWLTFSICTVVPTVLFSRGYYLSPHLQGTANDADFWFLILSTLTQIHGLIVSVLFEWKRGHLSKWYCTIPSVVVGVCSLMAIPLFLYVPKEWSSFLSLVAGVAQSIMISQFFLL